MTYILLENWAHIYGVKPMDAKNWARRGKFKGKAKQKKMKIKRWIIEKSTLPPNV